MSAPRLALAATLAAALLAGCAQAPAANADPAPSATPLQIATAVPPAAQPSTRGPADETPTLAPFPLSETGLEADEPPLIEAYPANAEIPLALSPHDHFYFSFPVASAQLGAYTPSQRYGVAHAASRIRSEPHVGIDVAMDPGTPVHAAAGGTVSWSGFGLLNNQPNFLPDPYGVAVVIRHDFGHEGQRLWTVYAHLSQSSVELGQRVEAGDVIGLSGNTGLSTGPHLHFEVRSGTSNTLNTRNPELWVAPPEGYGVLAGRVTNIYDVLQRDRPVQVRSLETGEIWIVNTYYTQYKVFPDTYYKENVALSNLPAGRYEVTIRHVSQWWATEVEIRSGAVTFFYFAGNGYRSGLPAEPRLPNLPN